MNTQQRIKRPINDTSGKTPGSGGRAVRPRTSAASNSLSSHTYADSGDGSGEQGDGESEDSDDDGLTDDEEEEEDTRADEKAKDTFEKVDSAVRSMWNKVLEVFSGAEILRILQSFHTLFLREGSRFFKQSPTEDLAFAKRFSTVADDLEWFSRSCPHFYLFNVELDLPEDGQTVRMSLVHANWLACMASRKHTRKALRNHFDTTDNVGVIPFQQLLIPYDSHKHTSGVYYWVAGDDGLVGATKDFQARLKKYKTAARASASHENATGQRSKSKLSKKCIAKTQEVPFKSWEFMIVWWPPADVSARPSMWFTLEMTTNVITRATSMLNTRILDSAKQTVLNATDQAHIYDLVVAHCRKGGKVPARTNMPDWRKVLGDGFPYESELLWKALFGDYWKDTDARNSRRNGGWEWEAHHFAGNSLPLSIRFHSKEYLDKVHRQHEDRAPMDFQPKHLAAAAAAAAANNSNRSTSRFSSTSASSASVSTSIMTASSSSCSSLTTSTSASSSQSGPSRSIMGSSAMNRILASQAKPLFGKK